MNRLARFCGYYLPALLYMVFIFYVSSGPAESRAFRVFPDYVMHAGGYAGLYVLVYWATHRGLKVVPGRGGYWLPLVITALYGVSDEFHQSFVPTREASVKDLLADTVGGLLGILLLWFAARRGRRGALESPARHESDAGPR